MVVLASKLQSASKFRRSLAAQTSSNRQPEKGTTDGQTEKNLKCPDSSFDPHNSTSTSHSKKDSDKMSTKDLQVIQSVTLICVIFILSQLPFQVISTVRLFVPEFSNFGSAENIYGFCFSHQYDKWLFERICQYFCTYSLQYEISSEVPCPFLQELCLEAFKNFTSNLELLQQKSRPYCDSNVSMPLL